MGENLKISDSKFIVIYGDKKVDGANKDGQIEFVKRKEQDTLDNKNNFPHYLYMNDFLKTHFKDSANIQRYAQSRDINVLLFLLANEGHITIAETSYPDYKSALVTMPRKCSDKQKERLRQFQEKFKEEKYKLSVISDYKLEDGIIEGKDSYGDERVLDSFIGKKAEKEKEDMEL